MYCFVTLYNNDINTYNNTRQQQIKLDKMWSVEWHRPRLSTSDLWQEQNLHPLWRYLTLAENRVPPQNPIDYQCISWFYLDFFYSSLYSYLGYAAVFMTHPLNPVIQLLLWTWPQLGLHLWFQASLKSPTTAIFQKCYMYEIVIIVSPGLHTFMFWV